MKRCGNCGLEKSEDQFHKHRTHGLQTQCIPCMKLRKQEWRKLNPDRQIGQSMEKRHSITLDEYSARLDMQNGICAVPNCDRTAEDNPNRRRLVIDHDHQHCPSREGCGVCIRGLLCQRCNLILGQVKDDEALLDGLASYLRVWKASIALIE